MFVTYHKSGKLAGMSSISCTCARPCAFSPFCYAKRLENLRPNVRNKYVENEMKILSGKYKIPTITTNKARFFSFGDYNTGFHINMANRTAYANPGTDFGTWIREDNILNLMSNLTEPNICKVLSIKRLNYVPTDEELVGFDTSFTVYSDIDKLHTDKTTGIIDVICSGECIPCGVCYQHHSKPVRVGEYKR